ncbi:MAG: hypothetical protein ABIK10_06070 [candidate division WOR-3 bacterium]
MKKLIAIFLVIFIIVIGLVKYHTYKRQAECGPQGSPKKAVATFMENVIKLSNLLWDPATQAQAESLLNELENSNKNQEALQRLNEKLLALGITNPAYLFKDQEYGKAAVAALAFYKFDTWSINEITVDNSYATLEVQIVTSDFLGLKSLVAPLLSEKAQKSMEPNTSTETFNLEKRLHKWYIVKILGPQTRLINALDRLRRLR